MINFDECNVKIQDGCSNNCSYCIIKDFRGPSVCFSYEDICEEIRFFEKEATNYNNTIRLTGINCMEYYHASVGNLIDLCKKLLKTFPNTYFVLDNINPFNTKLMLDLIDLISSEEHMLKDLFIPIQSASDRILKLMHRPYTSESLNKIFEYGINKNINLITEIIVGFPGETEEDFKLTYGFLQKYKVNFCTHVFSKHPNTEAASLPNEVSIDDILIRQQAFSVLRDNNKNEE